MAVRLNDDKEVVARIKEGLKKKGGYCPCRIPKKEEYMCICKEFKEQIADPVANASHGMRAGIGGKLVAPVAE